MNTSLKPQPNRNWQRMQPVSPTRRALEEHWRRRVHEALLRYRQAAEVLRLVRLEYANSIPSADGHFPVRQAQRYELVALRNYMGVLRILTDVVGRGKDPPAELPDDVTL